MTPAALLLLGVAAVLHTGWNLLLKNARAKQAVIWWALLSGSLCFAPFLLFNSPVQLLTVWPYVLASAVTESCYYIALTRAYALSDFSLIYPLARGTAPIFLLTWSVIFLGEHPKPGGLAGIGFIVFGLLIIGAQTFWLRRKNLFAELRHGDLRGILVALGVALCISIYSVIDGAAVRTVDPLVYTLVVLELAAVFTAPVIWRYYGLSIMLQEWRANWLRNIFVGVMTIGAYILVLRAYAMGPVSYAGAVREVSIVIAALVGWLWLGERLGPLRVVGAFLIFAGILIIALAG